jgi:hypothetical protein
MPTTWDYASNAVEAFGNGTLIMLCAVSHSAHVAFLMA